MFENKEAFGRIGKWATKLAEHIIDFVPRTAIKSQVLAQFIADWTPSTPSLEPPKFETICQLECDGAYHRVGAGGFNNSNGPFGHAVEICYEARLQRVY